MQVIENDNISEYLLANGTVFASMYGHSTPYDEYLMYRFPAVPVVYSVFALGVSGQIQKTPVALSQPMRSCFKVIN